jgi:Fe-S oxidoreductase
VTADVVTYTSFVAGLIKDGALKSENSGKEVVFQDPYQLARDLEETEASREIIKAFANLSEMLLNRKETIWAGNILMAQYMPDVITKVAERRIFNAKSVGAKTIVTASVSEYVALKSVVQDEVEILSIEDLIIGE